MKITLKSLKNPKCKINKNLTLKNLPFCVNLL